MDVANLPAVLLFSGQPLGQLPIRLVGLLKSQRILRKCRFMRNLRLPVYLPNEQYLQLVVHEWHRQVQAGDTPTYCELVILYGVPSAHYTHGLLTTSTRKVWSQNQLALWVQSAPQGLYITPFLFRTHDALGPLQGPQMFPKEKNLKSKAKVCLLKR